MGFGIPPTQEDVSAELPQNAPDETSVALLEDRNGTEDENKTEIEVYGTCTTDLECEGTATQGACMASKCIDGSCIIEPASDGTECATDSLAGNACVLSTLCDKGQCVALDEITCPSDDSCTEGICNASTGICEYFALPNCESAPPCNYDMDCVGKIAVEPCQTSLCEDGFCIVGGLMEDETLCFVDEWEGNPCILGGHCLEGVCDPLVTLCDDADPCTIDSCSIDAGGCISLEDEEACGEERGRPSGTPCGPDTPCEAGTCEEGICVSTCLDGTSCPEGSYCDMNGDCMALFAMGMPCDEDAQCATGACEGTAFGDKECVCLDFSDCYEDEYCGTFGINECLPSYGICDESCTSDKQCGTDAICAGFPAGLCVIEASLVVDQLCCKDAQCASGICGSEGLCQCAEESDCGEGVCDTAIFGANICVECVEHEDCGSNQFCTWNTCQGSLPVEEECVKDFECASGICGSNDLCQCGNSGDCGAGMICDTTVFGANQCVECIQHEDCGSGQYCTWSTCQNLLPVDDACVKNFQCTSDICGTSGVCQCAEDNDCGETMICDTSIFGANVCLECIQDEDCGVSGYCENSVCYSKAVFGESCEHKSECLSNICEGSSPGTCTCKEDSHCSGQQFCDTSLFGLNGCVDCLEHSDCAGDNYCNEGTCMVEAPIGSVCYSNAECLSKSCQGDTFGSGNCACKEDEDCGANEICDKNTFSPNECLPTISL